MASDVNALRDRLLADAIATGLRGRDSFTAATTLLALPELKQHLRERAQTYRQDISATEAEAETGAEQALQMWQQLMPPGRVWRTVTTLTYAATALLQVRGGEVVLQVRREEPGREILQWRFVSLALPQGILVAAVDPDGVSATGRVRVLDRSIAPDSPVAQQHVHHAAMISFEEVWSSLRLRALLAPGALVASLRDLRAFCPHLHRGPCDAGRGSTAKASRSATDRAKHMAAWGDVIRQAFIARRILERHAGHSRVLTDCNEGDCAQVTNGVLWRFTTGRTPIQRRGVTAYPWPDELVRLARRHRDAITPSLLKRSNGERTDFMAQQAANERALLRLAIMYVRPDERESFDPLFERLFVQYLRVKVAIFGLLVHQPGEHGLRKFLEHFSQIKVYAPEAEFLRPRRPVEPGLQVHATEYRVAPDAWFRARRRPENAIEEYRGEAGTGAEAAWVIHFKRAAPGKTLPLHGTDVRRMESDADQIVRSLSVRPSDLQRLRAIDICGVEDAQPSWVSAPTLRRVRRQSSRVAALSPRLHLEPLRLSIHTGEDFLWLTSGTRAIAEPFHWRLIERGDRIGHGIAITLEPNDWWERWNGRVLAVKRIDRLLDLAFLAEYAHARTNDESEWLRIGIEALVRDLRFKYGSGRSDVDIVSTARKFWRCLGSRVSRRLMSTSVRRLVMNDCTRAGFTRISGIAVHRTELRRSCI
jgi:hypothetical protein